MALLKFKGPFPGILVGVAATLAAPVVLAALAASSRPILKAAIKSYLSVADRFKEVVDDAREQFSDLVAEAREEHVQNGGSTLAEKLKADQKKEVTAS